MLSLPPLPDEVIGKRDGGEEAEAVAAALGKSFVKEEREGATTAEDVATDTSAMAESKAATVHAILCQERGVVIYKSHTLPGH